MNYNVGSKLVSEFAPPTLMNQRYYSSQFGRFMTPGPSSTAHPSDPQSWNQYASKWMVARRNSSIRPEEANARRT